MPIPSAVAEHVRTLFATPPTLAIVGATPLRHRAAYSVSAYLQQHGAVMLPVNPRYAGETILGSPCASTVVDACYALPPEQPLDGVLIFRRSENVAEHLDDLLDAHPPLVWMQLRIRQDAVAHTLQQRGIHVVQDRCLQVDHARVFGW